MNFIDPHWSTQVAASVEFLTIVDRGLNVLFVNRTQPGLSDPVGRSVLEFVDREYHDLVHAAFEAALDSGLPQHFETSAVGPAGGRTWYSTWILPTPAGGPGAATLLGTDVSHARRVEDELLESRATLRALLDNAPDVFWIVDRDHRVVFTNRRSGTPTTGPVPTDRFLGQAVEDLVPAEARDTVRDAVERVVTTGEATSYEIPVDSNGRRSYYWAHLGPVLQDGEVTRVSLVAREITEQRRMEAAIRDSEARHRSFIEQSSEGIFCFEYSPPIPVDLPVETQARLMYERGVLVECNDVMARAEGASSWEELVGRPQRDYREWTPELRAAFRAFVSSGYRLADGKTEAQHPDGSASHTLTNVHGVVQDGRLVRAWGVNRSVTELVRAKEALEKSERRLAAILDVSPVGIFQNDTDGNPVFSNERAVELSGFSRDSAPGRTWEQALHPDDRERVSREWYSAVAGGEQFRSEYRFLHEDGDVVWVLGQAVAQRDDRGRVTGYVGTTTDITERKLMEFERERLAKQLQQAQKMEAVGQLTGGVAHDFNNLLTVIQGNLELALEDGAAEAGLGDLLSQAFEAAERASRLTQRLLAFSRKQPLQPRLVHMGSLTGDMSDLLQRTLGETISVHISVDTDLWLCAIDPNQMENAILNLAINARDASDGDGVLTIVCRNLRLPDGLAPDPVHEGVEAGDYVLLTVTDDGEGIPAEVLDQVFDPFFTTKDVGRGSGLGLSMVYGFVRQSGGEVRIQSMPGHGTAVRLYVPRATTADVLEARPDPAAV